MALDVNLKGIQSCSASVGKLLAEGSQQAGKIKSSVMLASRILLTVLFVTVGITQVFPLSSPSPLLHHYILKLPCCCYSKWSSAACQPLFVSLSSNVDQQQYTCTGSQIQEQCRFSLLLTAAINFSVFQASLLNVFMDLDETLSVHLATLRLL